MKDWWRYRAQDYCWLAVMILRCWIVVLAVVEPGQGLSVPLWLPLAVVLAIFGRSIGAAVIRIIRGLPAVLDANMLTSMVLTSFIALFMTTGWLMTARIYYPTYAFTGRWVLATAGALLTLLMLIVLICKNAEAYTRIDDTSGRME